MAHYTKMDKTWKSQLVQKLVGQYPVEILESYVAEYSGPLLLLSLNEVVSRYQELQTYLPQVKHHFAIKSLPNIDVMRTIDKLGGYFDVATNGEIELLQSIGVSAEHCVHTHPITRPHDIETALAYGIDTFVFDNPFQIGTLAPFKDRIKLLLRLAVPNHEAQINLSAKFGLDPKDARSVLATAGIAGLNVIGASFHAGSQMSNSRKMIEGIRLARQVFDQAQDYGYTMSTLDIGGGFPAPYTHPVDSLEEFCKPVSRELELLFPKAIVLSEPGRGIVGSSITALSQVMGVSYRGGKKWYFLDDGVYASYSGVIMEHGEYPIVSLRELRDPTLKKVACTLAGPTCDSIDIIAQDIELPELEVGDIVIGLNLGAYSVATTTDFNLFPRPTVILT